MGWNLQDSLIPALGTRSANVYAWWKWGQKGLQHLGVLSLQT